MIEIDTEEFHTLMMNYRSTPPIWAHEAYQKVIDYINKQIQGNSND
jgi:hypothetical protein